MKKEDILKGYAIVNEAKLSKLDDIAKFKVIKACKEMKPIVTELQEFEKDAREKLKGDEHDAMIKQAEQWKDEGENTTLSIDERKALNKYFEDYNEKVTKCLVDELKSEYDATWKKLSEEELKKFVASNDWNVQQTIAVMGLFE